MNVMLHDLPSLTSLASTPSEAEGGSARPQTVLFVDDEAALRGLARAILERNAWRVLEAEDGVEALDVFRLQEKCIDLIILDLSMPRLSGTETFSALQELNQLVPVLFASGNNLDELPDDKHHQIVGFVAKPYRPRELVALVREVFERRGQPKAS